MEFVDDILTFEELSLFLKQQGCHVGMLSSLDFSVKNGIAGCLKALLREFMDTTMDVGASTYLCLIASIYIYCAFYFSLFNMLSFGSQLIYQT